MAGFFKSSSLLKASTRETTIARCGACQLHKGCSNPKMGFEGGGRLRILLVAEAPSASDDTSGLHFTGKGGSYVNRFLKRLGVKMRGDCWVTTAVICHTKNMKPDYADHCRPNLRKTVKELKPHVIVPMGNLAVRAVVGMSWSSGIGSLERWVGYAIPCQKLNAWICPTYSPDFVVERSGTDDQRVRKGKSDPVPRLLFEKHLRKAVRLSKAPPWKVVPDYKTEVNVVVDPTEAAQLIKHHTLKRQALAFDYETNMLKPDSPRSKIYSCGVCFGGDYTIAYPWHGAAIKATRYMLRSVNDKIATNMKFEDRWTRAHLKTRVRNWQFDTLLAAHNYNNIQGTKSVKFQAYVLLGQPAWNTHIEPLFESNEAGCYGVNRIDEIELQDLLVYNGMDALLEYKVAKIQMKGFKQ